MLTSKQIADQSLPKSRKQQKEEKSTPRIAVPDAPAKETSLKRKRPEEEADNDPKLKEFLDVMGQAPSKKKSWINDDIQQGLATAAEAATEEEVKVPEGESDDEYQVIEKKPKTSHSTAQSAAPPVGPVSAVPPPVEAEEDVDMEGSSEDAQPAVVPPTAPVSDSDWLRSRTNRTLDLVEDDDEPRPATEKVPTVPAPAPAEQPQETHDNEVDQPVPSKANDVGTAPTALSETDKIRQTARLYLRNLHFDVTKDDLYSHFSKYGQIEEVSRELYSFPVPVS